ncbi:MAG: Rrf2 family transcriptional regulator [Moraxellaceae bacterium]|nr:Rrf2 family transcriptional regulator [Moraxellaceae bacterium]
MRLTRFSDFGLRVLMYLTHERDTPVTIAEIAQQFDVPHNHLVKVANRLGKLGWVTAIRGRNGGLILGVPADTLRLGEVIQQLEECDTLVDCDETPCTLRGRCLLKGALNAGLAAFYDKMNEYSLADVCRGRTGTAIVSLHRDFMSALGAGHA